MAQEKIQDGVEVRNAQHAVAATIKAKELLNQPIARFDLQTKKLPPVCSPAGTMFLRKRSSAAMIGH